MSNLSLKQKVIAVIIVIPLALMTFQLINSDKSAEKDSQQGQNNTPANEKDKPQVVSTKPDLTDGTIVAANQTIEITFNRPMENVGEFKVRIDPEVKFKKELSSDRKTGKITPETSYELGVGYTLFIGTETKFDGVGRWGEEKVYHFSTVRYRGV